MPMGTKADSKWPKSSSHILWIKWKDLKNGIKISDQ